jgi:hypothetical protein
MSKFILKDVATNIHESLCNPHLACIVGEIGSRCAPMIKKGYRI